MNSASIPVGELVYEAEVKFTEVIEYGIRMQDVLSKETELPAAGVRIDVAFEGIVRGPRLKGTIAGVDYVHIRGDRLFQLHIHARFPTKDGHNIALFADGIAIRHEGTPGSHLQENVTFLTASPK